MKTLQISPQNYEVALCENSSKDDLEGGVSFVEYTFGETSSGHCFSAVEARKVGQWFLALSKKIEKAEKNA